MNLKTGRGGKKERGDKKEELIFGRKGIGKIQRDPKGKSKLRIRNSEDKEPITKDDLSVLRTLLSRSAKDYESAMNINILLGPRLNIEPEEYEKYMSNLIEKLRGKNWIIRIIKPCSDGNVPHFYLNFSYRDNIIQFIKYPPITV